MDKLKLIVMGTGLFIGGTVVGIKLSVEAIKLALKDSEKKIVKHRCGYTRETVKGYYVDNLVFETRQVAESVLSDLQGVLSDYGFASVGDLYDLSGVSTDNYTLHRYGWVDLQSAKIVKVKNGYQIVLTKALPMDVQNNNIRSFKHERRTK